MIATIILILLSCNNNKANGDHLRKLQSSQSYLTSLYPYLPSHPQKTCINTAQPQQWEISSASTTLDECCIKHFSWDTYTCEVEGKKLNATNYYKWQQEQYQQGGVGVGVGDGEVGPTPSPSRPTHPYIVNYIDETCYNDAALPYNPNTNEEIVGYTTLKQCCGSELRHIMSKCMSLGIKAYNILQEQYNAEDEGLSHYMPNWSLYKCDRSQLPNEWDVTYVKLADCCEEHFDWNLEDCLNSGSGGSSGQGVALDGSSNNNKEEEAETTYWYPIWSSSHCTTNHIQSPPTYMLDDPTNTMQSSYIECCTINFQNEQWTQAQNEESLTICLELSKELGPPTMQPTDIPDDTLTTVYYPDYTSDVCLSNGDYAPSYMKDDISTYFSITSGECCRLHFPTVPKKTCVQNSDSAVNNNDDSTIITSNGNIVNPYHYKFTYYPILKNVVCVMNIDLEAPSYMYDSTSVFFTKSIGECCITNYPELEVEICVENSNLVELGHSLSDVTNGDKLSEPSILVKFTCKLYFRNVYMPKSSTDHLITIRNVVTNAVKQVLKDEFRVVNVANVNFDGIDINNEDANYGGDDGLESKGLRQRQLQTTSQQLFTFNFDISHTCNEICLTDITNAGISLSQSLISIFDEAMSYNSIYNMIISDMNSMGYVGPFASSTLDEGFIVMDGDVIMDPMYTSSPTMSLPPTTSPTTRKPSMKPTPSSHNMIGTLYYPDLDTGTCVTADDVDVGLQPNLFNSLDSCCSFDWLDYTTCIVQADHVAFLYYPDLDQGTCINDGNEGPLQPNLFNTLDECCRFDWLEYDTCLSRADVNQTPGPTPPPPSISPSTSTPSRAPSAKPSKLPTKKPSPLKPSQTEWPTFSPTTTEPTGPDPTKRPTKSPTKKPVDCIGMGWHVDHIKTDGCSNNENYLEIWLMPHLKDQMFHPTAQACCDAFFADDCVIYDICAPDDDDSPSDSGGGDITDPVTMPPPEEDSEIDKTGEVCKYGWHVHKMNNDGCTNNEDIVDAWTSPQLINRMFYSDHASCCEVFFPNQACQKYDTGCIQA